MEKLCCYLDPSVGKGYLSIEDHIMSVHFNFTGMEDRWHCKYVIVMNCCAVAGSRTHWKFNF